MPVHEVAERGFGRAAGEYERGRPGYPPGAVDFLVRELGLAPGRTVLDVGAGTGKLTRLLQPSGARVLALEPVAGMREQLVAAVPGVELVGGTAEAIELSDAAVDAVTSATAFHWFDTEPALREFHRVLAPGGRLALLWNARDESVDWVADIAALVSDAVTAASDDATIHQARKLVGLDWRPHARRDRALRAGRARVGCSRAGDGHRDAGRAVLLDQLRIGDARRGARRVLQTAARAVAHASGDARQRPRPLPVRVRALLLPRTLTQRNRSRSAGMTRSRAVPSPATSSPRTTAAGIPATLRMTSSAAPAISSATAIVVVRSS